MADLSDRLSAALAGRYRIERELGAGGMATVYLAADLKHERRVAIKVLKPELAAVLGADRFLQEIKTTAALNHPHILPLFDSGDADGFLYYVMPYIEGETIREKLQRESQFAVDEAVAIATAIADALEYAHRQGVIHRDIKPENLLLHDGRPMVMDFGIALAVSAAAGGRMTETGLSLGTPHYMSPEQATAEKELTARSDQYALACVLYEMLAGEPPHAGGSAQQVIMKIITEAPADLATRRRTVPQNVAAAVMRALEKLPADRFASVRAFGEALGDPHYDGPATTGGRPAASVRTTRTAFPLLPAVAGAGLMLLAVAAWSWLRSPPPPAVLRYQLPTSIAESPSVGASVPSVAPDGSFLIYPGPRSAADGVTTGVTGAQLFRKRRADADGTPIAGTEDVIAFALSPDGRTIAFTARSQLRTVPVTGGVPDVLVASNVFSQGGVAWLEDGTLLFSVADRGLPYLMRVPAAGGETTLLSAGDTRAEVLPVPVPGTTLVFVASCASPIDCDLVLLDRESREKWPVRKGVSFAQWSPTGHLLFEQSGRLLVMPFDLDARAASGEPIEFATGVSTDAPPLHLSADGTLVLKLGGRALIGREHELVWLDRAGRVTPVDTTWRFRLTAGSGNQGWSVSPDGSRVALGLNTDVGDGVWVKTLPDGPLSRLSTGGFLEQRPRWSSDGSLVTFIRQGGGEPGVYARRADGTGRDSVLYVGSLVDEGVLSPDQSWVLVRDGAGGSVRGGRDIRGLRLGRDTALQPLIATRFDEEAIALSPDGRWIAYQSDETGRSEIFVRSFPDVDGLKRQLSSGGGTSPLWSRDGRELFYLDSDGAMIALAVTSPSGMPIAFGRAETLFRVPAELLDVEYAFYTPWDVAPDGRFLMARSVASGDDSELRIVIAEHWLTELRERFAGRAP